MEDYSGFETVKEKLITAGIKELQNHGAADFSLRRVATACNVSCAAPYKHFKSKEDFIAEILLYIHNQWTLLQNQVASIFNNDTKKQIVEICIAYIKFRIANPGFNAVLMMKAEDITDSRISSSHMTDYIRVLIEKYCLENNLTKDDTEHKLFAIRSFIYGAVIMIDKNQLPNTPQTIEMIKKCIDEQLETGRKL
jgi:AcrR family transcriptional regulator